ncbi:aminotransferase-like domain-containing protein [Limimaricola litoreus]
MTAMRIPADAFFLDRASGRSLQAQLREAVVAMLRTGQAGPGARLPSSRGLAAHLGIARMTVTLAYQELVAQGLVEGRDRRGYVVAQGTGADLPRAMQAEPRRENAPDWDAILDMGLSRRKRVLKPYDWRSMPYPFVYGQMDTTLFDRGAWRDCARQAGGARDFTDLAGDQAAADDAVLVSYIRSSMLPRRGILAETDEILITVGAQNALWLVAELLTRRPLRAVCENPGYPDTLQALRWCGAEVRAVDVDAHGLPPADIPDGTGAVFVSPSHHAPTGVTMPVKRRRQLLRAAADRDFIVVEDDYDFEMSYLEAPSPALKSLDRDDRVLYVGSFSKALFPGLRLGFLVGPRQLIAEARELRALILRHPPGHLQRTAAYFLAQGHYDMLVRGMRTAFAARRTALQQALRGTGLRIAGAAKFGGSSVWIEGPPGLCSLRLAEDLLREGVVIEPGAPFFDQLSGPCPFFRLGYSSITSERIGEGVARIAAEVKRRREAADPPGEAR